MGDDNEVRDLARIAKEVFLQDAEHIEAEKPKLYDMEQEFARTKANRSLRTILVTLGFVALAIGATIFLTIYIENLNKRIKIDIADFEDVTLKDLLSSARKNEDDLNNAKAALQDTQTEITTKSQTISAAIAGKISVLDAQGLEQADYDSQVAKLKDQEKAQLAALRASYAPVLKQRQAAIDNAQKAIDAYDQKQVAAAKKQEEVLNNEQRLHDLELAKSKDQYEAQIKTLKDRYAQEIAALKATQDNVVSAMKTKYANDIAALTLRYNPVFDTTALKNILALPIDPKLTLILGDLTTRLTAGKYVDPQVLSGIQDSLARRQVLYARIAQIPYRNSVPSALAHLDFLDRSIIRSHEDVAGSLLSIIQNDEAQIALLGGIVDRDRIAFEFYARDIGENGFVLDARNTAQIAVVVSPSYPVSDGDQGLVFRADNEYIGTIQFSVSGNAVSAKMVDVVPDKTIEPFDKFLIKKM